MVKMIDTGRKLTEWCYNCHKEFKATMWVCEYGLSSDMYCSEECKEAYNGDKN